MRQLKEKKQLYASLSVPTAIKRGHEEVPATLLKRCVVIVSAVVSLWLPYTSWAGVVTLKNNAMGTIELIELGEESDVKDIVFTLTNGSTRDIVVTNVGGATPQLELGDAEDPFEAFLVADNCIGETISPGTSCKFTLALDPGDLDPLNDIPDKEASLWLDAGFAQYKVGNAHFKINSTFHAEVIDPCGHEEPGIKAECDVIPEPPNLLLVSSGILTLGGLLRKLMFD